MAETDILLRMYNAGFGDAFLLELPVGPAVGSPPSPPFRMLIDCGAHSLGYPRPGWKPEELVDQIIADISVGGAEPRLDVVVATHRHQDHVLGFKVGAWKDVRVGEVWMPWTEDPEDPIATALRERQSRLALGMHLAFGQPSFHNRFSKNPGLVASLQAMVANSLTNEAAMATLHGGFRGHPSRRFLSAGDPASIQPAGCPGLTVHVLGPSRSEAVIRDMDPPTGASYLRFLDGRDAAGALPAGRSSSPSTATARPAPHRPFSRSFTFDEGTYLSHWPDLILAPKVKEAAASIMRGDDMAATVALDKAVNGTSLMLMIEMGDAYLLFPGDAQWGTWRGALDHPPSRELLSRTTFYKVGHHGSHNATPKEFVETVLANRRLWGAATSVKHVDSWPLIPKDELMTALEGLTERVVRSDDPPGPGNGVSVRGTISVDFQIPTS